MTCCHIECNFIIQLSQKPSSLSRKFIRLRQEPVWITFCPVRAIRWMHKNLSIKLLEVLAIHYRCVIGICGRFQKQVCLFFKDWKLLSKCYSFDHYLTKYLKMLCKKWKPSSRFREIFLTDCENIVSRKTRLNFFKELLLI